MLWRFQATLHMLAMPAKAYVLHQADGDRTDHQRVLNHTESEVGGSTYYSTTVPVTTPKIAQR